MVILLKYLLLSGHPVKVVAYRGGGLMMRATLSTGVSRSSRAEYGGGCTITCLSFACASLDDVTLNDVVRVPLDTPEPRFCDAFRRFPVSAAAGAGRRCRLASRRKLAMEQNEMMTRATPRTTSMLMRKNMVEVKWQDFELSMTSPS